MLNLPDVTCKPIDNTLNYLFVGPGQAPGTVGGNTNAFDITSNGATIASTYPTIKGTWAFNKSFGNVRWTGVNGNAYDLSKLKNNGGYVKSMELAEDASKLTRNIGTALTIVGVGATVISTYNAVANGKDNTSTWVNAGIGLGGAALTVLCAPEIVTVAAIGGAVWGVGQLVAGDQINGWIDDNLGYK